MEMGLYKKHMLADDILQIDDADQNSLINKVRFLNKVKSKALEMNATLKEDESQVVPSVNFHSILKRSFDILVSLTALLLLSPCFYTDCHCDPGRIQRTYFIYFQKGRTGL